MISFIIPVYNGEKYIEQCIQSILKQNLKDIEIIMIDDGSKDHSLEKMMQYQNDYISVYHQENKGVSAARNLGIQKSKGNFITFIDVDDHYIEGSLQKVISYLDHTQGLFANYLSDSQFTNKVISITSNRLIQSVFDPYQNKIDGYTLLDTSLLSVWGKFYSKQVIEKNHLLFDTSLKLSEDTLFNYHYLKFIDEICLIDIPIYDYNFNDDSVTAHFRKEDLKQRIIYYNLIKDLGTIAKVHMVNIIMNLCLSLLKDPYQKQGKKDLIQFFEESHLFENLDSYDFSYGKLQNKVYKLVVFFFSRKQYQVGFYILNLYTYLK